MRVFAGVHREEERPASTPPNPVAAQSIRQLPVDHLNKGRELERGGVGRRIVDSANAFKVGIEQLGDDHPAGSQWVQTELGYDAGSETLLPWFGEQGDLHGHRLNRHVGNRVADGSNTHGAFAGEEHIEHIIECFEPASI
jgi:hypothetical protein